MEGLLGKGIPPVEVRKLYGRVESKYMRVLMYFSPTESDACKSIKEELENILQHLKNNGHNVDLAHIRTRRTQLVNNARSVLHSEWNEIQKKMDLQKYYDIEDNLLG